MSDVAEAARTDWTRDGIAALFDLPFTVPVFRAVEVHRAGEVQLADTPMAKIDDIEFVRTVAVARITMPAKLGIVPMVPVPICEAAE